MRTKLKDSQIDKVLNGLSDIKNQVTAEDRAAAEKTLGHNAATISRYLNRGGLSVDTGFRLYKFFLSRINEREKLLA